VPTFKLKLWSFAMGASTGGLGGWIYASKVGFINPDTFPLNLSFLILAAVVLGGLGSTPGVIAGAFAVGFLPEYLREAAGGEGLLDFLNGVTGSSANDITEYRFFLFGLALILMMIFRPQGLLPNRQRAAELAEATSAAESMGAAPVIEEDLDDAAWRPESPVGSTTAQGDGAALPEDAVARAADVAEEVLTLSDVTMAFGGVTALNDVSITVHRGQIFGIIGPNGAGKTTLFNCVTGVFTPTSGDISLDGRSLLGRKPHQITEAGVARTFQNIRLFPNMTAIENVMVGHRRPSHHERARRRPQHAEVLPGGTARPRRGQPPARLRGHPHPWARRRPQPALRGPAAASRSPEPSPPSRRCCCSTSPPPGSTRPRSSRSSG
jgi:ABC-type multidrug transport system fused ATPase/permease subunit